MTNITSQANRLLHIEPGNRQPRSTKKPRAKASSTSEIFGRLQLCLLGEGPTPNVYVRRVVFACDRQRFYTLRDLLVRLGYVVIGSDAKMIWEATEKLEHLTLADIMPALEPQFARSVTHPDCVQVVCPLCGLNKKPWASESKARKWYHYQHIKTGLAHR